MLKLYNAAQCPWTGWVPFTVPDVMLRPSRARYRIVGDRGTDAAAEVVFGTRLGDARSAWVHLSAAADEALALDFAAPDPIEEQIDTAAGIPGWVLAEPMGSIGVTVNGIAVDMIPNHQGELIEVDGPALRVHGRALVGSAIWADVYLAWVPTEPWLRFELVLTCAHPNRMPMIVESTPLAGFELKIGTMLVGYHGHRFGAVLAGEQIAQGQARAFSGIAAWLERLDEPQKQQLVSGAMNGGPFAIATEWKERAGRYGVPDMQAQFNVDTWIRKYFAPALQQAWSQEPTAQLGVNWNSAVTGAQEDQVFCANGGEAFALHRTAPAAVFVRYLIAMSQSRRPCHWREADGRLLDFEAHPQLRMWSGQPHWHPGVSPDRLGLSRLPSTIDTHGWYGPDREHWFASTLWFAAAVTGSRALQQECESHARLVWFGETVEPGVSTTSPDAARSVGWFGILAVALIRTLADPSVRARVATRAMERIERVYVPMLPKKNAHGITVWDPRSGPTTSGTLQGYDWAIMTWQQSIGSYGLWVLARELGHETAREMAVDAARTCFTLGWSRDAEGRWIEWEGAGLYGAEGPIRGDRLTAIAEARPLPADQFVPGVGAGRTGWFRHAWMPLALAVLEAEGHADVLDLVAQLRQEIGQGNGVIGWWPPAGRLA